MIRILSFLLLLYVSTSCAQQNASNTGEDSNPIHSEKVVVIDISVIQKEVLGKNVQFIDIRTPQEYQEGFIDDAVNISFSDKENFTSKFENLNKNEPVYIYCYSGWRSHRAAKLLITLGFEKVYDFKGGYKAWTENTKR
ncbi:rhodanese-like domain-containing protein [uncultured Aquimarina sp.]|uniref:rhodanese-like domain-containing protein n=1 Tax=uncultured Aquimarina sp. TaxID=575652 RepID=UPI002612481B|nr:rhodanese-like domain-containing protein [uncultured Aquimarina sp.]